MNKIHSLKTNRARPGKHVDVRDIGNGLHIIDVKPLSSSVKRTITRSMSGLRPWAMLKACEDHKVDPVQQAVLWTARQSFVDLARQRIYATRAIGLGKNKVWRKILFHLKDLNFVLSSNFGQDDPVRNLIYRYNRWCIKEIQRAYIVRTLQFGITDEELRSTDYVPGVKPRALLRGHEIGQRSNLVFTPHLFH